MTDDLVCFVNFLKSSAKINKLNLIFCRSNFLTKEKSFLYLPVYLTYSLDFSLSE